MIKTGGRGTNQQKSVVQISWVNIIKTYSKTCVKQPLKNKNKKKILMANGSLMKVGSIADSAILLT